MVYKGHVFDGLDSNISQHVPVDELQEPEDAATLLKENSVDILIILLPTGSQKAAEYYVKAAIESRVAEL